MNHSANKLFTVDRLCLPGLSLCISLPFSHPLSLSLYLWHYRSWLDLGLIVDASALNTHMVISCCSMQPAWPGIVDNAATLITSCRLNRST